MNEQQAQERIQKLLLVGKKKTIAAFAKSLKQEFDVDDILCGIKESTENGMYYREMSVKAGTLIVGEVHKTRYTWSMSGTLVLRETQANFGRIVGNGALVTTGVCPAGTENIGLAITDVVFTTHHKVPEDVPLHKMKDYLQGELQLVSQQ